MNLVGSYDAFQNNLFIGTWDARRWGVWPFDLDRTFGLTSWQTTEQAAPDEIGWITLRGGTADQDPGFLDVIQRTCRPELRARWAALRRSGVVSMRNITAIVRRQTDFINSADMVADLQLFPVSGGNTIRQSLGYDGRWTVSYVLDWARGRIAWMDKQWGFDGGGLQ